MIECVPTVSVLVVSVAVPFSRFSWPMATELLKKVTIPVAVLGRVAVKVTGWLNAEGLGDEARVTVSVFG
ncbi:MAG: hypothetical protein FWD64_12700 [Acidobacteriaceae bacterium]|nr:hypothetical protein [Acidobacteriaceae bacterium]